MKFFISEYKIQSVRNFEFEEQIISSCIKIEKEKEMSEKSFKLYCVFPNSSSFIIVIWKSFGELNGYVELDSSLSYSDEVINYFNYIDKLFQKRDLSYFFGFIDRLLKAKLHIGYEKLLEYKTSSDLNSDDIDKLLSDVFKFDFYISYGKATNVAYFTFEFMMNDGRYKTFSFTVTFKEINSISSTFKKLDSIFSDRVSDDFSKDSIYLVTYLVELFRKYSYKTSPEIVIVLNKILDFFGRKEKFC